MIAAKALNPQPLTDRDARLVGQLARLIGVLVAAACGLYLLAKKGVAAVGALGADRPMPRRDRRASRPGRETDRPSFSGPQRVRARRSLCRQGPPAPSPDAPRSLHGVFVVARPC